MANLKFTKTHEWIKADSEDNYLIGITEHAQHLLGDMVFVELPQVGNEVKQGDELGVVESVKAASDFYAPISGKIVAINDSVVSEPSLVNQDPHGGGWLVKIKAHDKAEIDGLLDEDQYQNKLNEEQS